MTGRIYVGNIAYRYSFWEIDEEDILGHPHKMYSVWLEDEGIQFKAREVRLLLGRVKRYLTEKYDNDEPTEIITDFTKKAPQS